MNRRCRPRVIHYAADGAIFHVYRIPVAADRADPRRGVARTKDNMKERPELITGASTTTVRDVYTGRVHNSAGCVCLFEGNAHLTLRRERREEREGGREGLRRERENIVYRVRPVRAYRTPQRRQETGVSALSCKKGARPRVQLT